MAKKYDGLFGCPASDGNFTSAIRDLSVDELEAFKAELITRDLDEHCHKGRINAVAKEIKTRGANSKEILAVERMAEDIQTAEELYADGMPYELERIENEIRFYQDQAGTALLEMGRRLIRIKAHEGHGKFLESLERLGMATRSAQYAMLAARKFSNTNTVGTFERLGAPKMKALTVLEEDDIKVLESGGEVRGMKLDNIDRMGLRELRENLRKETEQIKKEKEARKKDRETFERAMTEKDAKINEMDMRLSGQEPPTKEQIARIQLEEVGKEFVKQLVDAADALDKCKLRVLAAQRVEGATFQLLQDWQLLYNDYIKDVKDTLRELLDLIDDLHPDTDTGSGA